MDCFGVDRETDVVHERSVTGQAVVDVDLLAVADRVECAQRVVAIEAEVEGEVVSGPHRDAEERDVAFDGHSGDEPERTVPAGGSPRWVTSRS